MKTMKWSSLRWLAVIVAVVLVEGNWARAAPSPRNDDMFRELLKLDQIYSSIARPRYTRSGPINIQMGPKAQRAIMRLRELDQEYGYKARPRYVRSGNDDNKNIKSFINNLYALDQEYGYKSRPRFGKRTETNSNFAPIDYDGQFQNDDVGDWLPVRR